MAVKTRTEREFISDISGRTLTEGNHARMTIRTNDGSWVLDAGIEEDLVQSLLSVARDTSNYGRANGNSKNN